MYRQSSFRGALALAALVTAMPAALAQGETKAPARDGAASKPDTQRSWTLHAREVYTSTGKVLENAAVVVVDGKITAITPSVVVSRDAVSVNAITAGFVDAGARIHDGFASVEQADEIQPHRSVAATIDPFDVRWKRLASSGVTTAYIAPLERDVIGGFGVALKTQGAPSVAARTLEGRSFVTGVIGNSPSSGNSPAFGTPSSIYNRRPTTRMGVEWEWRRAFFDAFAATRFPEREFAGADVLRQVLAGEHALYVTAWATADIRTAIFLKEEFQREGFGEVSLVLESAAEAWKEPKLLERSGASVILPPFPRQGRGTDQSLMPLETPKRLADLGVLFALSAHDGRDPSERLAFQAGLAMRGGLTREQALVAVTLAPARILGLEGRVGSIEVGKDADLVLWNGAPFEATSGIVGVLVDGVPVTSLPATAAQTAAAQEAK